MMAVLLGRLSLAPRLRELAILRLFYLLRCDYGFAHHLRIGKQIGLTSEEIDALAGDGSAPCFSELDRLVLRYTDAVTEMREDAPELAKRLRAHLSERELVELTFCIANWNLMARVLVPLAVEPEPAILGELPAWWPSRA
jgi:alkylhydroperoxidase family enzyme